ncbi:DUF305 domain-containing protein [Rufibacter immobilis]|uniref:DUF305 domain-containing protein n=1 Tax=Rufibacter immobilis TaxID=1348778 RepID=UPI0035E968FC
MKMKMKIWNLKLPALLCGASLFFSACGQNSEKTETSAAQNEHSQSEHDMSASDANSNKMMDLMHENMTEMQQVKLTGDPDRDFALLMATHHEGALNMAQEEADNGQDTMLVNMAKKSLQMQKEEKDKLQQFADDQKSAVGDTAKSMQLMAPMRDMMTKMDHNMKGGTDHHFASLMSMHHQSGIDMAKAYIPLAKAPAIKAMAQKIMDDQQAEKQKLDNWLQKNQQ